MTDRHPSESVRASGSKWSMSALGSLLVGGVGIAFAPIFVELGARADGIGPSAAGFWRMFFAAVMFSVVVRVRGDDPGRATFSLWLFLPGLLFAGDLAVWHWSFKFTNLANATLLANFSVVVVVIFGWFWFRERFGGLFLAGCAIALAGTVVLFSAGFRVHPTTLKGDLLGLATALFYGSYLVSVKILRRKYSTLRIMLFSCASAAPILFVVALLSGERVLPVSAGGWASMLGLALIAHGAGQALIAYALAHLPASSSAVTLLIQPLTVALLQWPLFGQTLSFGQLLGGGVILAGIILARLGAVPRPCGNAAG